MLRKTRSRQLISEIVSTASMRPQRNAAENEDTKMSTEYYLFASMRPQRNAAENQPQEEITQWILELQ